jgi:hypothetical protein
MLEICVIDRSLGVLNINQVIRNIFFMIDLSTHITKYFFWDQGCLIIN